MAIQALERDDYTPMGAQAGMTGRTVGTQQPMPQAIADKFRKANVTGVIPRQFYNTAQQQPYSQGNAFASMSAIQPPQYNVTPYNVTPSQMQGQPYEWNMGQWATYFAQKGPSNSWDKDTWDLWNMMNKRTMNDYMNTKNLTSMGGQFNVDMNADFVPLTWTKPMKRSMIDENGRSHSSYVPANQVMRQNRTYNDDRGGSAPPWMNMDPSLMFTEYNPHKEGGAWDTAANRYKEEAMRTLQAELDAYNKTGEQGLLMSKGYTKENLPVYQPYFTVKEAVNPEAKSWVMPFLETEMKKQQAPQQTSQQAAPISRRAVPSNTPSPQYLSFPRGNDIMEQIKRRYA